MLDDLHMLIWYRRRCTFWIWGPVLRLVRNFGQARDLKIHYKKLSWTLCSSQSWHIKPLGLGLFFAHVRGRGLCKMCRNCRTCTIFMSCSLQAALNIWPPSVEDQGMNQEPSSSCLWWGVLIYILFWGLPLVEPCGRPLETWCCTPLHTHTCNVQTS
jgi:hypothetical protein